MKIAVCEDLADDTTALCDYISDYFTRMGYAGKVQTFETGEALLEAFSPGTFDLVFLDIYLPGISGMEAAQIIREQDQSCRIIFVTASVDHTMDGFEVNAVGYLVKPIDQTKMDRALQLCQDLFLGSARVLEIPMGREGRVPLPLPNMEYVEVYGRDCLFHMLGGVFEARLTLDEVEAMLDGGPFLRCHRSYIINMNQVEDLRSDDFLMKNGDVVPMRRNGKRELRLAYAKFMAARTKERVVL